MSERARTWLALFPLTLAGLVVAGALALNFTGPRDDLRSARIAEAAQLIARAREAVSQEDWAQVREYAGRAVGLNPSHVVARLLLGLGHLNMNDPRNAEAEFRQVLVLAKEDRNSEAWAHNNLGVVFLRRGQFRIAAQEYETALALDPFNEQARANLMGVRRYLR